jgi:hypothetical protein
MPYQEARKLVETSGKLRGLPRSANDGITSHPARICQGNPGAGAFGRSGAPFTPVSSDGAAVTARKNTTPM